MMVSDFRDGFELSIEWKNKLLTNANVKSLNGGECTLRYKKPFKLKAMNKSAVQDSNGLFTVTFITEKGKEYQINSIL